MKRHTGCVIGYELIIFPFCRRFVEKRTFAGRRRVSIKTCSFLPPHRQKQGYYETRASGGNGHDISLESFSILMRIKEPRSKLFRAYNDLPADPPPPGKISFNRRGRGRFSLQENGKLLVCDKLIRVAVSALSAWGKMFSMAPVSRSVAPN